MATDFDPRRAEPGQEFGYTASEERTIAKGDELPEGATLLSVDDESGDRRVRLDGVQRVIRADDSGIVHPKTQDDVNVLDAFGLPVARKAKKEAEASDTKGA